MLFEIKCGKCKLVYPIKRDDYLKRINEIENNYRNRAICPSCWAEMPQDFKKIFDALVLNNGKHEEWEIGTNFQRQDKRD